MERLPGTGGEGAETSLGLGFTTWRNKFWKALYSFGFSDFERESMSSQ
jgi:G:T/U-mismatch repair DNA glycosylase